ncbi:uncharacterized protein BKCO1_9800016 [Diplodia corticola]|uniref:Uncharacterized protein n=1 Tax=Diplodia corticola TaxID=236234 RepID=A0A1J9RM48_9PEZI|nr:uncharacterized protein BKCO1_9800016 [Diplodia corticola]OJD28996.1 hypothetical protein BKCO1_9800016 [Diplodia corticola]
MENIAFMAIIILSMIMSGLIIHYVAKKLNQCFPTSDSHNPDDPFNRPRPVVGSQTGGVNIELAVFPQNGDRAAVRVPRGALARGGRAAVYQVPRRDPPAYNAESGLTDPPPVYSVGLGEHDARVIHVREA